MPWGLIRLQQSRQLHFITFSCYRRRPLLKEDPAKSVFGHALERIRRSYHFSVKGYVVMPEHVHLLVTEPERSTLAAALQGLKQSVAQKLIGHHGRFWQTRYYDFNVCSSEKRVEKLKYIHRNPVTRGLVDKPEDWPWSSYRHYATRGRGVIEIESPWTEYLREHPSADPDRFSELFKQK